MNKDLYSNLKQIENSIIDTLDSFYDICQITKYNHLVNDGIWTKAIQESLNNHKTIIIPPSSVPYIVDNSIIVPSNRKIIAYGATIKTKKGMDVLLLRNEHPVNETYHQDKEKIKDENIGIFGGTFEEDVSTRMGYGKSGKYDNDRTFYGISCCILFNNIKNIVVRDVTFKHCGGFAIQTGKIENAVFQNIYFDNCFADGLHYGGNIKNILIENVKGNVGDDIVALNMYDWQDSSVNFGPGENIWCENIELYKEGKYKAIRLLSGMYKFKDGSKIDCKLSHLMIKNVRGIKTFKLYLQTPPYLIGTQPEWAEVGSMEDINFEDIDIDLFAPIDPFKEYTGGDMIRGTFASFELGSNINGLNLKNINLTLHKDKFPSCYLLCAGPKSIIANNKEVFDPYLSCIVNNVTLDNIVINGEKIKTYVDYIKEISFDNVNNDGNSTGKGQINNIVVR